MSSSYQGSFTPRANPVNDDGVHFFNCHGGGSDGGAAHATAAVGTSSSVAVALQRLAEAAGINHAVCM